MMFRLFCLSFIIFHVHSINLSQLFQDSNPFASDNGKTNDTFMLIPSIGYENNDKRGSFTCTLDGWYYKSVNSYFIKNMIKKVLETTLQAMDSSLTIGDEDKPERFEPFFVVDIENHRIKLKLNDKIVQTMTTDKNGRFHQNILVDSLVGLNVQKQVLKYIAIDDNHKKSQHDGIIYLMKNTNRIGCSIISDIDDTIKISEVPFKIKLLINTFKKPFRPVPGMSDVYRSWESIHKCLLHYVSAMPSQLYYATQTFLNQEKFPGGSFHMRHLKLVDKEKIELIEHFIDFIKRDAGQKHKISVIELILRNAPINQQFIMVGDSGEMDPEIYGIIARRFPRRINRIFIRIVEGGKNNDDRFDNAFQNVSRNKWKLFSDANELPKKLYDDIDPIHTTVINDRWSSVKRNDSTILSTFVILNSLVLLVTLVLTVDYNKSMNIC